jgi:hypothetical protein
MPLIVNYIYRVGLFTSKARATAPGVGNPLHLPARIIQKCPSGVGSAADPARCGISLSAAWPSMKASLVDRKKGVVVLIWAHVS